MVRPKLPPAAWRAVAASPFAPLIGHALGAFIPNVFDSAAGRRLRSETTTREVRRGELISQLTTERDELRTSVDDLSLELGSARAALVRAGACRNTWRR